MPLEYAPTAQWPPVDCHAPYGAVNEWDAWYSGDRARLMALYGTDGDILPISTRTSQYRGGLVGRLARFWWGQPIPTTQPSRKIHVPLAADIAQYSADLLYSSPPDIDLGYPRMVSPTGDTSTLTVIREPDPRSLRWDRIVEYGRLWPRLREAAELIAAHGGGYLKAVVAPALCDVPFVCAERTLDAIPTWSMGWLTAVTFHRVIERDDDKGKVWRHLERYEVVQGYGGVVYHGVYAGTDRTLGMPLPATQAAAMFPQLRAILLAPGGTDQGDGTVSYGTGTAGLAATYIPNMLPNRMMIASSYGRSDYATSEGVMDALDETWSSLLRDIRLGKGRITVPSHALQSQGRGQGASIDLEQEVYSAITALPGGAGDALTVSQFAIRVDDHLNAARAMVQQVMRTAGYDPGSLDDPNGAAKTATEVANDASRTIATRGRKIGYWTPAVRWVVETLTQMDAVFFRQLPQDPDIDPNIEWPAATSPDPEKTARTIQLLDAAGAVSTRVKVEMTHPDWDDPEIEEEVARITSAAGQGVTPPDEFPQLGAPAPAGPGGVDPLAG